MLTRSFAKLSASVLAGSMILVAISADAEPPWSRRHPQRRPARADACPATMVRAADGACVCPEGHTKVTDAKGVVQCVALPACAPGLARNAAGECVCPEGQTKVVDAKGIASCVTLPPCPAGTTRNAANECVCPEGQVKVVDAKGAIQCVPK